VKNRLKFINEPILPAIKKSMNPMMNVYDTEILAVIKQLHKVEEKYGKAKKTGRFKNAQKIVKYIN
jgi:hypothetical protein